MKLKVIKNTAQGTFWGLMSRLISLVFPFVIRTIIIRTLGAEYTGVNGLFSSVLQVLSVAELGFGAAVIFAMYKPVAADDKIKISAYLLFYKRVYRVIGGVILALGLAVIPFLNHLISGNAPKDLNIYLLYIIYLVNTVSSYFFFAYYGSILNAYQRQADSSKIQLFVNIAAYLFQIVALLKFKNFYFYVVLLPISTIMYNFFVYKYTKRKYSDIRPQGSLTKEEKRSIRSNIIALSVYKVGGIIANSIDTIIVSTLFGLVMVSNFNNYYYVINGITSLMYVFFNSLTAGVGNRLIHNNNEKNVFELNMIFSVNALIVVICTTCLYNIYQDFMSLWVGNSFLLSNNTMVLFCVYFFVHTIRKTMIMYIDAAGFWRNNMFQPIVGGIVNLLLDIVFGIVYGIPGVIFATIFTMLVIDMPWETVSILKNKIEYSIKRYFLKLIYFFIVTIVCCICSQNIINLFSFSNVVLNLFYKLFISFVFSLFVFCVSTYYWKMNIKAIYFYIGRKFFKKLCK